MRSPARYAFLHPVNKRRPPAIPEDVAFSRVVSAIKALKAMPDPERRFLMAGTKSGWAQPLVEWADLVAQAEQPKDDADPRDVHRPTRREVSDAIVAGEWFAKLALMPENIDEFERRLNQYASGGRKSPQVDDQRILSFYAFGWSLKLIGERYGLNEFQTERRIAEIRTSLHRIANGWARLADVETRGLSRKAEQAARGSREKARF